MHPRSKSMESRVEKKISVIWNRASTMMVHANMNQETQNKLWVEAVACAAYLEDLTLKENRNVCALEAWTGESWWSCSQLCMFGRGIVAQRKLGQKGDCLWP